MKALIAVGTSMAVWGFFYWLHWVLYDKTPSDSLLLEIILVYLLASNILKHLESKDKDKTTIPLPIEHLRKEGVKSLIINIDKEEDPKVESKTLQ
jgi:hypothetical protein